VFIETPIQQDPQRFITRNSAFVIAASEIAIDDNKKIVRLTDPSILNGAQSQGEIKRWIDSEYGEQGLFDKEEPPFFVRAEIIVDPDSDPIVETAERLKMSFMESRLRAWDSCAGCLWGGARNEFLQACRPCRSAEAKAEQIGG
jgi:hypothetical protein